jgi:hypothetical protein
LFVAAAAATRAAATVFKSFSTAGSSEENKLIILFLEFINLILTSLAWTIASVKNRRGDFGLRLRFGETGV